MSPFPHLFTPVRIGSLEIRNRIVQSAHGKGYSRDGAYSQRDADYQEARARGGVGLIITGSRAVHPTAVAPRATPGYRREAIPGDRKVIAAVHRHGARIFAQLAHRGPMGRSYTNDDPRVLWGPSPGRSPSSGEVVKAMDQPDIEDLIEHFSLSAEVACEAGYDGIELHFAHSYLVHQFMSPLFNHRVDEYGGSEENRLRLPLRILEAVRLRVGAECPIGIRMGVSDFRDDGLTLDDTSVTAATFRDHGADYLSLSTGGLEKGLQIPPADVADGWLVESLSHVKAAVGETPVIAVGAIKHPAHAEEIIANGDADLVAMTRAQIADPDLARKAQEGREQEIYHCIRGNQGCIARTSGGRALACTVNPAAGREHSVEAALRPTRSPKRWLVVGGGPAGMKAAETLAIRGHEVTLVERDRTLGGQVNLIVRSPGRAEFRWITKDLSFHLRQRGVSVLLGQEASPTWIRDLAPDGIVVATGALPDRSGRSTVAPMSPGLRGADQDHVISLWDALLRPDDVGEAVVILDDDGTRASAGVVEILLDAGRRVHVITRFKSLFPATTATLDSGILGKRLASKGLTYELASWADEVRDQCVHVRDLSTGGVTPLAGIDTVVLATAAKPNDELYEQLRGEFEVVRRAGDCVVPRSLDHAIYEGFMAGLGDANPSILDGSLEQWR